MSHTLLEWMTLRGSWVGPFRNVFLLIKASFPAIFPPWPDPLFASRDSKGHVFPPSLSTLYLETAVRCGTSHTLVG